MSADLRIHPETPGQRELRQFCALHKLQIVMGVGPMCDQMVVEQYDHGVESINHERPHTKLRIPGWKIDAIQLQGINDLGAHRVLIAFIQSGLTAAAKHPELRRDT